MAIHNISNPAATDAVDTGHRYMDWGAIVAGALLSSAVSMVLLTFGTGIGLSMVSPYEGEGVSKTMYFVALGLWTLWVVVSSFMAGGYIAGRMRRRVGDTDIHEVEVRDGIHGLSVWALGLVAASIFVALGVSGVLGGAAKIAGPAAATATDKASNSPTVDALFRSVVSANNSMAASSGASDQADNASMSGPSTARRNAESDRAEVGRLLASNMVRGELNPTDKTYVASLVAANTGMSQADAERRVSEVIAQAKQKADAARKIGILLAFATAVALLVGGAAAMGAAALGGKHRDEGSDHSHFWRWH